MRFLTLLLLGLATPALAQLPGQTAGQISVRTPLTARGGSAGRTLADKLGDTLSVLDFGAKCDGATDDSAAITAAMASRRRIAVPSGMVLQRRQHRAGGDHRRVRGPGPDPDQRRQSARADRDANVGATGGLRARGNVVQAFDSDLSHVPLGIEVRITGAGTLGQPATGYQFTNEASPVYIVMYNESGWNQSTGTSVAGRTGFAEVNLNLTQNGAGDAFALFSNVTVSGPNKAGATSFLANPAASLFAGQIFAGHAGVYLQGLGDLNLNDNGFDVAAIGSTINLGRTVPSAALGTTWIGYRVQSSGGAAADAAFSAAGAFKVLLDAVDAPTAPVAAAVAGQRYYANASQPSSVPFPGTIVLGTEYMDYSAANGWELVTANGALSFGTASNRLSAGAGQTNTGIGSTALGGYSSVSGTYATALGGAHQATGNASTLMGQQAGDHGQTGATCHASGSFPGGAQGSAQSCEYTLRAVSAVTTGVRLTADGLAPSPSNCVAVQANTAFAVEVSVMARDTTQPGVWARFSVVGGVLERDAAGPNWSGPAPTLIGAGAGASAALAVAADAANGCLAATFSAPNTDTWHVVATVRTTEVQ